MPLLQIHNIYSLFRQPSADFSLFLLLSRLFRSLPFATIYIIFWPLLPKNVPDYSSLCDSLLAYYIRFENVRCHYINLIDLKYSISPLKSFGLSCCHYSQKWFPNLSQKEVVVNMLTKQCFDFTTIAC